MQPAEVLHQSITKARKQYDCDLAWFIYDIEFSHCKMSFSELRILAEYKINNKKIMKGDIYIRQFNKKDGDVFTFRAKKDVWDLLNKYDLLFE